MRGHARVAWAMLRGPVLFLLVAYATCGLTVAGSASSWALVRATAVLVPFLVYSAVVNDLADARIDAVNLPDDARRVLAAGTAHRRQLAVVAAVALACSGVAAAGLGGVGAWVLGAGVLVSTAYSLGPVRLADRGIVASLSLPACYVAVPYLIGVVAGRGAIRAADLPLLGALYVGFIGRIVLKDFRDVRGDALFGKRTFLVRHGRTPTCWVSATCWAGAALLVVAVTPHRTPAMVAGTLATTGLALGLIRLLAADPGHRAEEWIISALAIVGRGTLLVVLTPMAAATSDATPLVTTVLTLGTAVVTIGLAADMVRHGPSRGATRVAAHAPAAVGTRHT